MIRINALSRPRQQGFVLITVIMLTLILIILALAMISLNSTQTQIATNSADAEISFQTAEAALHQAEDTLLAGNYPTTAGNGFYSTPNTTNVPLWTSVDWTSSAVTQTGFTGSSNTQGAYIIELLQIHTIPLGCDQKARITWYRVTARAVGPSGKSPVLLQSTVHTQC